MASVSIFSFFAGCGILDLAFEKTKYDIVFVNEFSQEFLVGYQYAHSQLKQKAPIYGYRCDSAEKYSKRKGKTELIRLMDEERKKDRFVGFIGGPPCPDFSVGGKNAGSFGENGKLTRVYFDIICRCKPDFFVFENVRGLIKTEKHKKFYNEMRCKVQANQYYIAEKLLNALEYGVPQFRERIIMIGINKEIIEKHPDFVTPEGILSFDWGKNKKYNKETLEKYNWPTSKPFMIDDFCRKPRGIPRDLTVEYWFRKNDVLHHPNAIDVFRVKEGYEKITTIAEGDTKGKSFKRLHRWKYSPTAAYGHNEVHLHPYKARRISVSEAMAIQSLPRGFALPSEVCISNKFKMIGNGVPYLMARSIAIALKEMLDRIGDRRDIYEDDNKH